MNSDIRTYFSYREGLDPECLRLGNMVHDYGNPMARRPFIHGPWNSESISQWVSSDERPFACMIYQPGKGTSVGGGLSNLTKIDIRRSDAACTVIVGRNASKLELKEPQRYFEDVLLKSPDARDWFTLRLSNFLQLKVIRNMTVYHPDIWLLTGIYLIEDVSTGSFMNATSDMKDTRSLPLPNIEMLNSLLKTNPKAQVQVGSSILQGSGTRILRRRVWAAQYQRICADYAAVKKQEAFPISRIHLVNRLSAQRIRGETSVAIVKLVDSDFAVDEPDEVKAVEDGFTSDYWEEFEVEAQSFD